MVGVLVELLTRAWVCYLSVPSSAPLLVSTRNLSSSSIAMVWQRPLEANGEITEYTLTLFGTGGSNTTHTPNTSFVLNNLLPYTAYNLTITAATRKGSGPYLMLQLHTDEGGQIESFSNITMRWFHLRNHWCISTVFICLIMCFRPHVSSS